MELLKLPAPDAVKLLDRIATMERDLILPIKAAGIAMLLYSFYFKRSWIGEKELGTLEITVEATQYFLWVYIAANVVVAGLLLAMRRVPLLLVQWAVFAMSLVDGIFLSALVVVTGGYDSILYWLFLALIVRGAVSVPRATSQMLLNLTLTVCYVMAGVHQHLHQRDPRRGDAAWTASQRMPRHSRGFQCAARSSRVHRWPGEPCAAAVAAATPAATAVRGTRPPPSVALVRREDLDESSRENAGTLRRRPRIRRRR